MIHVLVITSARFRLPFELLLIPFAGLGILAVSEGIVKMVKRRRTEVYELPVSPVSRAA